MFDSNIPGEGGAPKNLPVSEPDDMFAKVDNGSVSEVSMAEKLDSDSALDNGLLKKKTAEIETNVSASLPRVSTIPPTEMYETKEPILGKIFIVIIIVAAAAGLGYGAWRFYVDYTENTGEPLKVNEVETIPQTEETSDNIQNEDQNTSEETTGQTTTTEDVVQADESILDDDKDGLNNAREKELNTDPKSADTDEDDLRDGDEVTIWQTNPLNPDSDGDSYLDGEEIKNGYNPLGAGKLFSNTAASSTEETSVNI